MFFLYVMKQLLSKKGKAKSKGITKKKTKKTQITRKELEKKHKIVTEVFKRKKNVKKEYERNRYKNMPEENKQKLKEYVRSLL